MCRQSFGTENFNLRRIRLNSEKTPQQAAEERTLKTKISILALFLAAALWTPAHATPVLINITLPKVPPALGTSTNLTLSNSSFGYIGATGYDNLYPTPAPTPPTPPAGPNNLNSAPKETLLEKTDGGGVTGLGLNNSTDNGYIPPTDGIVLDLSTLTPPAGYKPIQITFDLWKDITGGSDWAIYGTNGTGNSPTWSLVSWGQMSSPGALVVSTTSIYTRYAIGLSGDCALDIQGGQLEYIAPEPGTFAMAGLALIGLGAALRKRRRKI